MIEVSAVLFTLIVEGFIILLAIIIVALIISKRCKNRDRKAANQLVKQIKHQSQTRIEQTGSFLNEKYHFEGNGLKKAVQAIDKSEKRFFQKIINMYLKRDSDELMSMDASVAEMIDTYKSLEPIAPQAEGNSEEDQAEIERLKQENASLSEELASTRQTMSEMVAEFGNMFGGGSDNEVAKFEVMEKFKKEQADKAASVKAEAVDDEKEGIKIDIEEDLSQERAPTNKTDNNTLMVDGDIDDLLGDKS